MIKIWFADDFLLIFFCVNTKAWIVQVIKDHKFHMGCHISS